MPFDKEGKWIPPTGKWAVPAKPEPVTVPAEPEKPPTPLERLAAVVKPITTLIGAGQAVPYTSRFPTPGQATGMGVVRRTEAGMLTPPEPLGAVAPKMPTPPKSEAELDVEFAGLGLPTSAEFRRVGLSPSEFAVKHPTFAKVVYGLYSGMQPALKKYETWQKEITAGKFEDRIGTRAAEIATTVTPKERPTTGNKALDLAADVIGAYLGFSTPGGVGRTATQIGGIAGAGLAPAIGKALPARVVPTAARIAGAGVGGAAHGAGVAMAEGQKPAEIAKRAGEEAALWMLSEAVVGGLIRKATPALNKAVLRARGYREVGAPYGYRTGIWQKGYGTDKPQMDFVAEPLTYDNASARITYVAKFGKTQPELAQRLLPAGPEGYNVLRVAAGEEPIADWVSRHVLPQYLRPAAAHLQSIVQRATSGVQAPQVTKPMPGLTGAPAAPIVPAVAAKPEEPAKITPPEPVAKPALPAPKPAETPAKPETTGGFTVGDTVRVKAETTPYRVDGFMGEIAVLVDDKGKKRYASVNVLKPITEKAPETVKEEAPKPYAGLQPGTPQWMDVWRAHPELQEEMLEYQKRLGKTGVEKSATTPGVLPLEQVSILQRVEEPGIGRASFDKPHGIYTTPIEYESPHADLGGKRFLWKRNPDAKTLVVNTGAFPSSRGRVPLNESAGVAVARRFLGDEEVLRMMKTSKRDLIEELGRKVPGVDWKKYYDQQEMIEGYAGILAREKGYDAIYALDNEMPEFTEYVALTEKAMSPISEPELAKPAEVPKAKEPWQMTREEYARIAPVEEVQYRGMTRYRMKGDSDYGVADKQELIRRRHELLISRAVHGGQQVPPEVLGQYPNLVGLPDYLRKVSETWRMPQKEAVDIIDSQWLNSDNPGAAYENASWRHKNIVQRALREGKPVPPEVLKDYPELAKSAKVEAPAPAEQDVIARAIEDWNAGRAYVDNRGVFHIQPRKSVTPDAVVRGPVAPWNQAVKKQFKTAQAFMEAAQAKKPPVTSAVEAPAGEVVKPSPKPIVQALQEGQMVWLPNKKEPFTVVDAESDPSLVTLRSVYGSILRTGRKSILTTPPPGAEMEASKRLSHVEIELSSQVDKVTDEVSPPVGLSIGVVKSPPPIPKGEFEFSDADTEARYQRAHEGVRREGFWTRIREIGTTLRNKITREYEHLPRTGEFAPLRYGLLELSKQKGVAGDRTVRLQQGIISQMLKNPAAFNLFERKVLLNDLVEEMDAGHDLPLGFTEETLPKEVERLNREIVKYPEIADALQKRSKVWDAIKTDYVKAMKAIGFDVEERFTKKNYFRHQVLEYANARAVSGTGQRIKTPTGRGFLKAREGSMYDINTNYLQAEFEVMAQMLYDIEVAKVIRLVQGEQYNIASKVKEKYTKRLEALLIKVSDNDETAIERLKFGMRKNDIPMVAYDNTLKSKIEKLQPGAVKKAGLGDWRSLIPEGHEIWQPREGNVFYFVDSIPSQVAQQLMEGKAEEIGVKPDDVRRALAMGGPRREFVVKSEVAQTLDNFGKKAPADAISKAVRSIMGAWKEYQLINPKRIVKYNARNLSGDAEAVFLGNPSAFKKVGRAAHELYQTLYGDRSMTPTMRDWFERGGMESTLQVAELGDINQLRMFSKLFEDKRSIPKKMWDSYVSRARLGTDFREAILRYAAYLDYLEQMETTKKPKNFGASIPEEIMALPDVKDRAFVLSNQLLGAYDQVSVAGQAIRTYLAPFWSWKEVNAKRYFQLVKNAASDGKLANAAGRTLTGALKRSPVTAFRVGRFLLKASALWAMLTAYNNLRFPNEERDLPADIRNKPHIVLGRDKDGKVRYFDRLGILGDFLEWFGLDAPQSLVADYLNGRKTLKDCAVEMVKAPINTFWQAIGPHVKTPVELLMGKKTYSEVYKPSTIRDKWLYLAESVGLGDEYKTLMNMPARPYSETLQNIISYSADPGESSYYDILDEKNEYMGKIGKGASYSSAVNPRSKALYYLKLSVRYGDKAAFEKYLAEYVAAGGSEKGYEASVRSMDPLYGLTSSEKKDFEEKWLDAEGRIKLNQAREFYEQVIEKGEKMPGATKTIKETLPLSKPKK